MSAFQLGSMSSSRRFWFAVIRAGSSYLSITCLAGPTVGASSPTLNSIETAEWCRWRAFQLHGQGFTRKAACKELDWQPLSYSFPLDALRATKQMVHVTVFAICVRQSVAHLAQSLLHLALDAPILNEQPISELAVALLRPAQIVLEPPRRQRPATHNRIQARVGVMVRGETR